MPTTLYFRPDGSLHIGHDAIRSFASLEAGRTIVRERQQVTHEIDTVFGREMVVAEIEVNQTGRFFQSLKRARSATPASRDRRLRPLLLAGGPDRRLRQ